MKKKNKTKYVESRTDTVSEKKVFGPEDAFYFGRDARQTQNWADYLSVYGWDPQYTSSGILVSIRKTPVGALVKIQRPRLFSKEELLEVIDLCKRNNALFVKLESYIGQDMTFLQELGFVDSGFPFIPSRTMFIDLNKSVDELWGALSGSAKYAVRRAYREGARIERISSPSIEKLSEYYEVLTYTGRTKGFYIQPFKDLLKKVELWQDKALLVLVYDKNNVLCGGKFFLAQENNVLFLHGGTSKTGRKNKTGYALLWDAILFLKELGFEWLDLEGLDDPRYPLFTKDWGGFSHFKEKFGGITVEFPRTKVLYLNKVMKFLARFAPVGV